jgi:glycosyltransferase involved in cell wall biosynthesis
MRSASYLVCPSLCYEQFPRILAEAFASGLPVVASRRASLAELIDDGETGLLFTPGSASDLAEKIRWADAHPSEMLRMGRQARRMFEEKYTPARNYEILMDIYAHAAALGPTDAGAHGARKEVLP